MSTDPAAVAPGDDLLTPFQVVMPPRPYPGLRPFDESEWPLFFGRERMVDAVVTRLLRDQCLVVHGDSGSGKSSLIRAGVLPRLRHELACADARWRTCVALPRGGPLGNLARELAALDGRGDEADHVLELRRLLNQGRQAPAAVAAALLRDGQDHLCLLVDQFEELFEFAQQGSQAECKLMTDFIVRMALDPPPGLYLVLTMRSEFLGACARFQGLAEAVNARQYLLPPMSVADLLRAIREPAELFGGHVETPLAERLATDAAGLDGLPLVQHALMRLHASAGQTEGWRLTPADYPPDGLAGLLSRHADEVTRVAMVQAGADERLIEHLFRALTTVTAEGQVVRRPQPMARLAEVCGVPMPVLARVVEVFCADGVSFLTTRHRNGAQAGEAWIDIGHEALVRCWAKLCDPRTGWLVREVRDGLIWRSLLVQAESFEANRQNVLSETTTEERQQWLAGHNAAWAARHSGGHGDWDCVQALIQGSQQARDDTRQERRHALWLRRGIVVAVVAAVAAGAGIWERTTAKEVSDAVKEKKAADTARQLEKATQMNAKLQESLDTLKDARLSRSDAKLRAAVDVATGLITTLQFQSELDKSEAGKSELAPRIYLHIGQEGQRAAVEQLRALLAQQHLGDKPLVTPGVQLVKQPNQGVLRCFAPEECAGEARQVLELINGLLQSPQLQLQDLSKPYATANLRPSHYEAWFGENVVRIR